MEPMELFLSGNNVRFESTKIMDGLPKLVQPWNES